MRDENWLSAVTRWVSDVADLPNVELAEVRTEPWSTVWRSTAEPRLYFKESLAANPAEGSVQAVLADLAPDLVAAPVGWDETRGWLLTVDGGVTVKDSVPEVRGFTSAQVISDIFQRYARLQLSTVGHGTRLREAGLPDGSPKLVGRLVAEVVEEMATVASDDPRHIDAAEHRRLDSAMS